MEVDSECERAEDTPQRRFDEAVEAVTQRDSIKEYVIRAGRAHVHQLQRSRWPTYDKMLDLVRAFVGCPSSDVHLLSLPHGFVLVSFILSANFFPLVDSPKGIRICRLCCAPGREDIRVPPSFGIP